MGLQPSVPCNEYNDPGHTDNLLVRSNSLETDNLLVDHFEQPGNLNSVRVCGPKMSAFGAYLAVKEGPQLVSAQHQDFVPCMQPAQLTVGTPYRRH